MDEFPREILVRCGSRTLHWPYQAGHTVLETGRRHGISISTQCEQGYCGTCIFELLKGEMRLRINNVLSEAELADGLRLACQAIPTGKICEIALM